MKGPDKKTLSKGIYSIKLSENDLRQPQRLDNILADNKWRADIDSSPLSITMENWEQLGEGPISHKATYIPDYHNLHPDIEDELDQLRNKDLDNPGLAGANLASKAIEVLEEEIQEKEIFSPVVIGWELNDLPDNMNVYQVGGPQGMDSIVDTPEWYDHDDWYSEIINDEYLVSPVNDPTVYARHIKDNAKLEGNYINSIDDRFWRGYEETIEKYTEQKKKVKNS